MLFISRELSEVSTKLQEEIKIVEAELKHLPQGRLVCERQGGNLHFVKETYENKKRIRHNLSPNDPVLPELLKRHILDAELNQLKANSILLKCALTGLVPSKERVRLIREVPKVDKELAEMIAIGIKDFDMSSELYSMKTAFLQHKSGTKQLAEKGTSNKQARQSGNIRNKKQTNIRSGRNESEFIRVVDQLFVQALSNGEEDDWANEPYERLQYQDNRTKWQITSFGLRVRSKSELIIAEMLHNYGIAFRYEQMLRFDNSSLAPDFTIRRNDGRIIYWEHEGLTNSNEYLNHQLKKSQIYAMNDIVPWDNLIVTYDNSSGLIDMRIVESEIQNKIMV